MTKLIEQIKKLDKANVTCAEIENIEKLIEEQYLKNDPNNIELWTRLALLELMIPLVDTNKCIECLNKILELDSNNINAILLLSCVHNFWLEGIDDHLFNKISNFKTNNNEDKSLLEYVKSSYYYDKKNDEMYIKSLEKSIEYCYNFVRNYWHLARFYKNKQNFSKAKKFIEHAIKNVQLVYDEKILYTLDNTDINEYFNNHLKGIHLSSANYEMILEDIEEISNA